MRNAVSEVTGYIYIFGIVMTVLAIVFVQVSSMVENMKKSILSQSLEQSFKRIQYIVHSVAFGDVPSQIAEIELQGGAIFLEKGRPEFIIAFVNNSNSINDCLQLNSNVDGNAVFESWCLNLSTGQIYPFMPGCNGGLNRTACLLNRTVGELRYEYKGWVLSIEAGAIFSKYLDTEYSKILYEPRILLNTTAETSKYLVITIPLLKGDISLASYGRFRITIEEEGLIYAKISDVNAVKNDFENVFVIVKETRHHQAWCRFFENFEALNISLDPENCFLARCTCYTADIPMAKIDAGDQRTTVIIVLKDVLLKS